VAAIGLGATVAAGVTAVAPAVAAPTAAPTAAVGPVAPIVLSGDQSQTIAVDISPLGVVVGTSNAPPPPDIPGGTGAGGAVRWLPLPNSYLAQPLPVPAGTPTTTSVSVAGVTDLGEAGGTLTARFDRQPVRWSVTGLQVTTLGPVGLGTVDSVGPAQWGVYTGDSISGTSDIVARDGTHTPLAGTPQLADAREVFVGPISGPNTAQIAAVTGVGRGTRSTPLVWRNGATVALPVVSSFDIGPTCLSGILADGTIAYSGTVVGPGPTLIPVMAVHRGGVPGTEVPLPTGGRVARLGCSSRDTLASDGSVAGQLQATADKPAEAALWRGTTLVPLGVRAGESATTAAAIASRDRVVLVATTTDGASVPYLWSNGVRTPLTLPAGWTLRNVVELTDAGVVLANVQNAAGDIKPVVWRTRS
jgi:hypothetical protein